jgi:hypothetical protein
MKACVVCNSNGRSDVPGGSQKAARPLFGEDALSDAPASTHGLDAAAT